MFVIVCNPVFSQISSVDKTVAPDFYEFGLDIGITSFFGDIDEGPAQGELIPNNLAFKFHAGRNFAHLLTINGQLIIGGMSGEKIRDNTSVYFIGDFIEYTFGLGFNTVALFKKNLNNMFALYLNFGVGLIDIKTTLYDGNTGEVIKTYGIDGATTELVIPLGGAFIYNISRNSAITFQSTLSMVNTDKIDGLEGNDNRDYYNFTSIGYVYKLVSNKRRPIGRKNASSGRRKK